MSGFDDRMRVVLKGAVDQLPKPIRMRAMNSMIGFEKAFALFEIDLEMASFRAITAQEEAAVALFLALQARKYPGADRLSVKHHDHKAALWPVLMAARRALHGFPDVQFQLNADPPSIRVAFKLRDMADNLPPDMADARVELVNPLDMLKSGPDGPVNFDVQLAEIVAVNGAKTIRGHVRDTANARNSLLYASETALPKSKATIASIEQRRSEAEMALCLTIGVLQTWTLQAYALQALECFLTILDKAEGVDMPHHRPKPDA